MIDEFDHQARFVLRTFDEHGELPRLSPRKALPRPKPKLEALATLSSFVLPPTRPELGGGLTHPTTEGCR